MSEKIGWHSPAHGEMVAHIVEILRGDILARRIGPAARLVEADLTGRFKVSRGPIREALRRLAAEGLIEHVPNRGAVVRRLSTRDISELFAIRGELEALAARLAAAQLDPHKRSKFEASIAPIFDLKPREACDYLVENAEFHGAIAELAGNAHLRELAVRLQLPLIMAQVGDILTPEVLDQSVHEHRAIARAILASDEATAAAEMRAHLARAAAIAIERSQTFERERETDLTAGRTERSPSNAPV